MYEKLTKEQAYELGYKHGAEMARESGSADPGCDGWDGMLINADVRFCIESFGEDFRKSEELAEYIRGAQAGADEQVKGLTMPNSESKAITLKLWVSNQVSGNGGDCTDDYLSSAAWVAPDGVTLDAAKQTLSGADPEVVWRAFCLLSDSVAELGNGDDIGDDAGQPCLTACPVGLEGAARSLARHESTRHETWAEFVAAVPALRDSRRREIAFVVRDAYGEYVSDSGRRTPASNEAREYGSREEAEAACERVTDRVFAREIE